ncbi:MAG: hypothetical protein QNJ98_10200 [Planctomycetota bacterium]|nr:hypothetical protein [Planctomycetota bacterium]
MRPILLIAILLAGGVGFAGDTPINPGAPVAVLGNRAVTKAELVGYLFDRYPTEYARALDELIDERFARDEARRIGLVVPPASLARAVAKEVEARTKLVREVYGPEAKLADWVKEGYGLTVDAWQREVLAPRIGSVLLKQRVVRLFTRSKLRLIARIIVTFDQAKAQRLAQKLQSGADFSLVALKESEDATRKVGGTLPPIARGDLAGFPIVEQRLFAARPGALLGPWRVQVGGKPQYQIYKLVRREEPWQMTGAALFRRLETDLGTQPVTQAELEAWQRHVRIQGQARYLKPDGTPWRR